MSVHRSDYNLERPESVGRPVDEMMLFGPEGEVCVRGLLCLPHYLGDGVASYYGEKWFRTGDLGVFEEASVLYLVGRCKDCDAGLIAEPGRISESEMRHHHHESESISALLWVLECR